ncbi:putative pyridine nucleotide-disulfide oxidoreductase RclA (plasmid) [Enterobacter cloacae]|nr:putative pyridine nucleotide-disulfide oxidoreductase RclA [Enterobacter cloacae]
MNQYQALIVAFGKAGKTLAVKLAKAGWRVVMVEQSNVMYGGTYINIGYIPTQMLLRDAERHHNFETAMQRKVSVDSFLRDKNFRNLADLHNVDVIEGRAEFIDCHTVRVFQADGIRNIRAEKIFINTGAQATVPEILGLSTNPGVVDRSGLLNISCPPERLGILGGGYIGVEISSIFSSFGTWVTISSNR